jgi:phosphoglycerate kinase
MSDGTIIKAKLAIASNATPYHTFLELLPEIEKITPIMTQNKKLKNVVNDDIILDIGPKTIEKITNIIHKSKTILWNGPAGYFENPNFANGSIKIAKKIIEYNKSKNIFSVVGGGDTVSLLNSLKVVNNFNFVSTAGGAFLEYLEGKKLPGITALN